MTISEVAEMQSNLNPLPRQKLLNEEGLGGRTKANPEDFIVDEIPLYEPCGSGEHIYMRIQKQNLSHGEAMTIIARYMGVSNSKIGFAGMKDKHAITTQTISVQTKREFDVDEHIHEKLTVLWAKRHTNKIKRGHLAGNSFSIKIRDVDPLRAPFIAKLLNTLKQLGIPNYFGEQRFGYRTNNHLIGALIIRCEWKKVLDEMLGTKGSKYPEFQQTSREFYDAGEFELAQGLWPSGYAAEKAALRELSRGFDEYRAVIAMKRPSLNFYVSATQSAIFNWLLDDRLSSGTLSTLEDGDLAWKHDSGAVFKISHEELKGDVLQARLASIEISPSGPLWGTGMTLTDGEVKKRELNMLKLLKVIPDDFTELPCRLTGARRSMRARISNCSVSSGIDEEGSYIN